MAVYPFAGMQHPGCQHLLKAKRIAVTVPKCKPCCTYHHHHQFLLSLRGQRASTKHRHLVLFPAILLTSLQLFPFSNASLWTVLRHVCLGLPLLLLPSGFQSKASLSTASSPQVELTSEQLDLLYCIRKFMQQKGNINCLKSSEYFKYGQEEHKKFLRSGHTVFMSYIWISEKH